MADVYQISALTLLELRNAFQSYLEMTSNDFAMAIELFLRVYKLPPGQHPEIFVKL